MRRSVRHRLILGAAGAALLAAAAPGTARPSTATKWEPPVLVSAEKASRETSLAVNPRNPDHLFVCDPSGVPATNERQSFFHRSTNGGRTWQYVRVETAATDTRQHTFEGGDCDVAYDDGGTMWSADTWLGNLSIGYSRDGKTWEGTALAVTAPVVDRPWIVGGPPGTLYVTYHDLQCCTPAVMWFTKTTDYGKTFSPAVPITSAGPEGAFVWEGNFVLANGGKDLYLVYSRRVAGITSVAGTPMTMLLAESHDSGLTWSSRVIATIPRETTSIYPAIAMDAGGWLHVVWAAPRADDDPVFYTTSKDRGRTWTEPRVLNSGKSGYAPWVAGGKRGEARVVWLGSPQPKEAQRWYFYVAKVAGDRVTELATTTRKPIWEGRQTVPEFEMIRLDKQGRMHIGMSVFTTRANGTGSRWATYYQREALPKRR